jgi:hypothetical protein
MVKTVLSFTSIVRSHLHYLHSLLTNSTKSSLNSTTHTTKTALSHKLRCKATYFYTLACTQAHPWMHAYGDSHALNNMTTWEDSGIQRSERTSMLHCMNISYPVLIYNVISCSMLLFFIFPTYYHFYYAHFPQTHNHIHLWKPLALPVTSNLTNSKCFYCLMEIW